MMNTTRFNRIRIKINPKIENINNLNQLDKELKNQLELLEDNEKEKKKIELRINELKVREFELLFKKRR